MHVLRHRQDYHARGAAVETRVAATRSVTFVSIRVYSWLIRGVTGRFDYRLLGIFANVRKGPQKSEK